MAVVVAIDAGTTGVRSLAVDEHGRLAAVAYREFTQHFPRPGWVEHDAAEIWARSAGHARRAVRRSRRAGRRHRHHQPARDGGGLEPPHRPAAAPGHRLAGPPHRGALRRAGRRRAPPARAGAHRARARPLLLGHQAGLAAHRGRRRRPGPTWPSARSTRWIVWNLTGGAAFATDPSQRQPHDAVRHRTRWRGTPSWASCSACPLGRAGRGAPDERSPRRTPSTAPARRPAPRSAASSVTSRAPCSARPASRRA